MAKVNPDRRARRVMKPIHREYCSACFYIRSWTEILRPILVFWPDAVGFPFAEFYIYERGIAIYYLWREILLPFEQIDGVTSVIGWGIRIHHRREDIPKGIVIWSLLPWRAGRTKRILEAHIGVATVLKVKSMGQ